MNGTMPTIQPAAQEFLEAAYTGLDYQYGALLETVDPSQINSVDADEWLEKGNWLELGKKLNAEKIFFVRNDPVIVFRAFDTLPSESEILAVFRQTWCMTRSQYLYLALPGELRVYGLRQSPPQDKEDSSQQLIYEAINKLADVSVKLSAYRREQLESGYFPNDRLFGKADEQADRQLINDLKEVRKQLRGINGLRLEFAHALIGRSIFIRYLEDRGVLRPAYFEKVANKHQRNDWLDLLNEETPQRLIQDEKWQERRYYKVLHDKDFTYALFEQLAEDFNGDLFPKDAHEKEEVIVDHLRELRKFLLGDTDPNQPRLWLWAYDFEIVPIELISSIYEEFYKNEQDDPGTHYTPSVLVEFVLSQVLPLSYLEANPAAQILDPACGSGIFLVESYRRLVRYRIKKKGQPLNSVELREILRDQIRGIELNRNAAYVAAFSLYLALLHYQKPSDILAQIDVPESDNKPLPNLIYNVDRVGRPNQYGILFNCNTFALTAAERAFLQEAAQSHPSRKTLKKFLDTVGDLSIASNSVDVVVGNPPWGRTSSTSPEIQWCTHFNWSIGDNELSQVFIARTLNLLKTGGLCGLLVKATVFLTHYDASQKFRQRWLNETTIKSVFNFTHVREIFFETAIAPFALVYYQMTVADFDHRVFYWSAKRTKVIKEKPSVILHLSDLKQVEQRELQHNYRLWKTYWWGNHRDAALINVLKLNIPLERFVDKDQSGKPLTGRGFEGNFLTSDTNLSHWDYKELPVKFFSRYGAVEEHKFIKAPETFHRPREGWIYEGWRLLVKEGINQAEGVNGRIEARLENENYCYRNSIYVAKLDSLDLWKRKTIIAILWSSLARYYFFMTASSWGTWNHKIYISEIREFPIYFPNILDLRERIVTIVDKLRAWDTSLPLFKQFHQTETTESLERQLDEAIFDLYELNDSERDLVLDMCETGLEFFYRHSNSNAIKPLESYPQAKQGFITDLPQRRDDEKGLQGYLYAFLDMWQSYLEPNGVFRWRVVRPTNDPMVAVVFTTQSQNDSLPPLQDDDALWTDLKQIAKSSQWQINTRIYIDGLVRLVTNDGLIIIIKRNERRLWTRSQAREDAEATFVQAMRLQEGQSELG